MKSISKLAALIYLITTLTQTQQKQSLFKILNASLTYWPNSPANGWMVAETYNNTDNTFEFLSLTIHLTKGSGLFSEHLDLTSNDIVVATVNNTNPALQPTKGASENSTTLSCVMKSVLCFEGIFGKRFTLIGQGNFTLKAKIHVTADAMVKGFTMSRPRLYDSKTDHLEVLPSQINLIEGSGVRIIILAIIFYPIIFICLWLLWGIRDGNRLPGYSLTITGMAGLLLPMINLTRNTIEEKSGYSCLYMWFLITIILWVIVMNGYKYRASIMRVDMYIISASFVVLVVSLVLIPDSAPFLPALIPLCLAYENYSYSRNRLSLVYTLVVVLCQIGLFCYIYYYPFNSANIFVMWGDGIFVGILAGLGVACCIGSALFSQNLDPIVVNKSVKGHFDKGFVFGESGVAESSYEEENSEEKVKEKGE